MAINPNKKSPYDARFHNFFSTSNGTFIRSSMNFRRTPAGDQNITKIFRKENMTGQLKKIGTIGQHGALKGLTVINGASFLNHIRLLNQTINTSLWMFVQAMGSHAHLYFQNTFEQQSLGTNTHRWRALRQATRDNREKLGFPTNKALMVTDRLRQSLKIKPSALGANLVWIYADKSDYAGAYPEFVGTHLHKRRYNANVGPALGPNGTPLKDSKGRPLYGRKGRFYAHYHLDSSKSSIYRPYIGANVRDLHYSDKILFLMDQMLFYNVFNKDLTILKK